MIRNHQNTKGRNTIYFHKRALNIVAEWGAHFLKRIKLGKALSEGKPVLSSSLPEIYRPRTVTTKM